MEKYLWVVSMISCVVGVFMLRFIRRDYKDQLNYIKGSEYRKQNGAYDINKVSTGRKLIKNREWLTQRNGGIKPESYRKRIAYIEHLDDSKCIVSRKGL